MLQGNRIESIFHPSDFSEASEVAFAHALKLALASKAELSMLHATDGSDAEWQYFPGVREILERWKLIPEGSPRSAVSKLGIDVRKVLVSSNNPVTACLGYLERHPAELIVLAVHQSEGRMRWLEKSVGKPMARRAGQMTLFVPHGVEGFVSQADGSVSLRNILIPVTNKPSPQPALEAAQRLIAPSCAKWSMRDNSSGENVECFNAATQSSICDTLLAPIKAVVTRVSMGEADAGVVYVADVAAGGVNIEAVTIPDAHNVLARYPIAILKAANNPDGAKAFVAHVLSASGQRVLAGAGFSAP